MHFLNLLYLFLQSPLRQANGIPAQAFESVDGPGIQPGTCLRFRATERTCWAPWRPLEHACAPPSA